MTAPVTLREGKIALVVEPHSTAGHGIWANTWRYTVTVDTAYGPSIITSEHIHRNDDAAAKARAVELGTLNFRAAVVTYK